MHFFDDTLKKIAQLALLLPHLVTHVSIDFSFKVCKNWCKTYEKDVIAFSLMFTAICAFNDLVMMACLHGF